VTERDLVFYWERPKRAEIDLHAPLGNALPLHIEVGSGRGEFIADGREVCRG
jgi:tRNA G46 methylase TrmB